MMKKRWIAVVLIVLLLGGILVPSLCFRRFASAEYIFPSETVSQSDFYAVAHRGFSALAPENTLAAFRLAGEYGFWAAECDVQPTADGVWVIMHDDTVDRMTNGTGAITEQTYDALQQYAVDAGSGVKTYTEEKIPTLAQYLDVCLEYDLVPVIEIKRGEVAQMASLAKELLQRPEHESFILISFLRDQLAQIKTLMPRNEMYLLTSKTNEEDIRFCVDNGFDGLDFNYPSTKEPLIAQIQAAGLKAAAWTIDDPRQAETLYQNGVKVITTNRLIPDSEDKAKQPKDESYLDDSLTQLPNTGFVIRIRNFFQWLIGRIVSLFG